MKRRATLAVLTTSLLSTACGGGPSADDICGKCPNSSAQFGFNLKMECEQTYGECRGDGPCLDALAQSYEVLCP